MKTKHITILLFLFILQQVNAQVYGCTDPMSSNYNPNATVNNGTCMYASESANAESSVDLPDTVDETSGLVFWDGNLYTQNDDSDTNLYRLNSTTGSITQTLPVTGTSNQDWEDIDQDESYLYIGDFGNNANGNRSNLRVIRVDKIGLLAGDPTVNSINFSYSDQTNFTGTGNNNTDFDCEAFIVGSDKIYLFTKQWVSHKTSVYSLPKTPGTHVAQLLGTYDVNGLITGATYLEDKKLVVLCGYSTMLSPFAYLLYDFTANDFFGGNKRKIDLSLPFTQIESIATVNGTDFYMTNERFQQSVLNVNQQLHHFDLSVYLEDYLDDVAEANSHLLEKAGIIIYPNPALDTLNIQGRTSLSGHTYTLTDMQGKNVLTGSLSGINNALDIPALQPVYICLALAAMKKMRINW